MQKKLFKQFKEKNIFGNAVIILILLIGIFFSRKIYSETGLFSFGSLIPIIVVLLIIFLIGDSYRRFGVRCPQCKSKLYAYYEQMENDKEAWVQMQFPCKKCDILWDSGARKNINDKDY